MKKYIFALLCVALACSIIVSFFSIVLGYREIPQYQSNFGQYIFFLGLICFGLCGFFLIMSIRLLRNESIFGPFVGADTIDKANVIACSAVIVGMAYFIFGSKI